MSTSVPTVAKHSYATTDTDAGYAWFLENRDEIFPIIESDELLQTLQNLELEHNLPTRTAERFKALYDEASILSEQEEERYATTWDAYHESLDNDPNLATVARVYAQSHPIPFHHRMDATGTLIF